MTIANAIDPSEKYLRFIEDELMGGSGGGRWIATFNMSIRNFNISRALKDKKTKQKRDYNLLVYGSVRQSGFILSRAFAFVASPTYRVGCAVVKVSNVSESKWSSFVNWIRDSKTLMETMEFEWLWILFYGKGLPSDSIIRKIKRHSQKDLAILYADIHSKEIVNSDAFIARRGATLFHPKNVDKKGSRLKFWSRKGD